jgi:hypothetical protein
MLSRFGTRLLVLALVLLTGGHWALLQSIAWFGMAVNYSQHSTLKEALIKTFDGQHPCRLCKAVQQCNNSEKKQASQKPLARIDLFCVSGLFALKAPAVLPVATRFAGAISTFFGEPPPKPPPRSSLG